MAGSRFLERVGRAGRRRKTPLGRRPLARRGSLGASRKTRRLLALIGVHFDAHAIDDPHALEPPHATALFEYCQGRWHAEGKRLDEVHPAEVVLRMHRFEAVVPHQPRRG